MKQRQSRGLMPWILTLLCAVLLTVWVLGSMPAAPKEGAAVAAGTAYLDSAAAKDASAIAETLREREKQRRAELLAKQKQEERDALVAKITSGELDIWSMFDSYVILGDSRAVGFYYFDFLEKSRVLADGGNTIRDVAAHMDDIRALQPDYVYLCYGLNDISIGYWDTKEEYVAELLQVVADLKEALPGGWSSSAPSCPRRTPLLRRARNGAISPSGARPSARPALKTAFPLRIIPRSARPMPTSGSRTASTSARNSTPIGLPI